MTRELAEWVAGLRFEDLPEAVIEEAGRAFADFLGECLFVGATKPWGQSHRRFLRAEDGGGQPEATIIASGRRPSHRAPRWPTAPWRSGFEYADFGAGSRAYPFAVTGPLALAESRKRPGQGPGPGHRHRLRGDGADHPGDAADRRIDSVLRARPLRHFRRGRRRRPGAGAVGRNTPTTRLGLAAAFTGGTFQGHEEGAWQRSLNGGMASERGVTAALLAETGFRATEHGPGGRAGVCQHVLRRAARCRGAARRPG